MNIYIATNRLCTPGVASLHLPPQSVATEEESVLKALVGYKDG